MTASEVDVSPQGTQNEDQGVEIASAPTQSGWARLLLLLIPVLILALGGLAGYLTWQRNCHRQAEVAAAESMQAAKDATIAMLSYQADTVEKDLHSASSLLTGSFVDSYTKLVDEVVIPGAKKKKISAVATIPATASVSASPDHAVALVFVDQTINAANAAPTSSASSVRVTLDKVDGRWLVAGFDPV